MHLNLASPSKCHELEQLYIYIYNIYIYIYEQSPSVLRMHTSLSKCHELPHLLL
jgi:hypothetical protein